MELPKKILISIPAKNEAATIQNVIRKSLDIVKKTGHEVMCLVVNDGSTDKTEQLSKEAGAHVISHKDSVGLGTVFQVAVEYATVNQFDLLITIDGDDQFSIDEIPNLLAPILNGSADFVTGSRFHSESQVSNIPYTKHIGNIVVSKMVSWILKKEYKDVSCGFRVYTRKAFWWIHIYTGGTA